MEKYGITQAPVPQNDIKSQIIKNEIHDIIEQLSEKNSKRLLTFARGLLNLKN